MTSFLSRFKTNPTPVSPNAAVVPARKDPNAPQPTPLEKLLAADAGPIRTDGSDKFFGFENFGSTCYANSIIQCLYYSVPFRESVINFPTRSPEDVLLDRTTSGLPRINTDTSPAGNVAAQKAALSPAKQMSMMVGSPVSSPKKPGTPGAMTVSPGMKPEDNKDSPEYKKKQAMTAGPVLAMDYENSRTYGMSESLFTSLKDIFEAIIAHRSRVGVVSPQKFLETLRRENEMFRTAMHQDAHEFLNLLLNEVVENVEQFSKAMVEAESERENGSAVAPAMPAGLSSAVIKNSASNTGWVHELFEGTLTSETRCLTCENTSQRDEAFLDLSVDLEQHTSVTSCLRKFSEEEMLCERNKFHCDNCGGLQEAEKRMKVKRLPRILALHLKRFKYTEDLQRLQKLFHRVVYPYYLRLFNTTDDAEDPDRLYELYAVVVHIGGGPYHGHYVSIIKTQDRGWLLFDDEMVEPVDKSYVRNFFGGENVLACAYVLFYQETTFEAMQREQEAEGVDAFAAAAEVAKEGVPVGTKADEPPTNGSAYPFSPTTPAEELDTFNIHSDSPAAAAPLSSSPPPTARTPIETAFATGGATSLGLKRSDPAVREEKARRAKEEKERKLLEKELEKQAKQKRKEMESKRRENYRKQEDEYKAAIAASKASKAQEDKRQTDDNSNDKQPVLSSSLSTSPAKDSPASTAGAASAAGNRENGHHTPSHSLGSSSGSKMSLNRFRQSSISLRHRPKFWSRDEGRAHDVSTPEPGSSSPLTGPESGTDHHQQQQQQHQQPEKKPNRFSLGRKKSSMLGLG
ncbi:cysteine proteinase [Saccharata proteae CBS 121410]|uniref:Ubiquitin carboxyl-terminal hydrolase n=1 Tax=Saccharata proteae CBS 121410 TaxID=1314787 RepID=A0A9P4HWS3_9PEZI|nr:cysteine proteinase [Saccharata proteae CBS 121410]